MAISTNPLLKGMRGSINKQIVVKQYAHKTVVTKYPDMSRVVLSPKQKEKNANFADAVKYAQGILRDPEKYRQYKKLLKPGQRVYNHAIKAYLASVKGENLKPSNTEDEAYQYGRQSLSIRRMKPFKAKDERKGGPIHIDHRLNKPGNRKAKTGWYT